MSDNDLTGKVGLDTTNFKTGVSELNAQIKSIETGFRASAAVMGSWNTSSEGLTSRTSSLSEKLELQKQKLSTLSAEYQKTVTEQGVSSNAAAKLAEAMFSAEKAISSTEKSLSMYDTELKKAETQEKSNSTSLGRLKSAFSGISDQSQKSTSSISSHFNNLKGIIAGFGATLIAGLSINTIAESTDAAEKAIAQMGAVLTSTGGAAGMTQQQLIDLAAAQAKVTTYSKGTTEQAENMLLTFTNIKSDVFPQTIKAAEDMATAMGTDATDAAKMLGKAMNDPSAGLSKLTKQGVTFTDQQKEQIKTMQAAGDTAGAQKIILDELAKEFGGSATAAGATFSGQMQITANNLKSVGATIGMALLPIVTNIMPSIISAAQKVADWVTANKPQIQDAVTKIGTAVKDVFGFISEHGPLIKDVVIGIVGAFVLFKTVTTIISGISAVMKIWEGVTKAMEIAQAALNLVMSLNPIALVVIAIVLLVAGFVLLWNKCEAFRDFWKGLWDGIKAVVSAIGTWFSTDFVNFFKTAWSTITGVFSAVGSWFSTKFTEAVNGIHAAWGSVTGWFTGIKAGIANAFSGVGDHIKAAFTSGLNFIKNLPTEALQWGKDIINGIVNGIKAAASAVGKAVSGIAQTIRGFLHFSVPDEGPLVDFESWMPDFMSGLATGMTDNISKIKAAAQTVAGTISIASPQVAQTSSAGGGISGNVSLASTAASSSGTIINEIRLDGKIIGQSTSRVQYGSNVTRSRSLGVVLA